MKIPEELIIGIEKWETKELWNMTKIIQEYVNKKDYNNIKYGINNKFNINKYIKELYTSKEKSGYVVIDGKQIQLEELWDEMEKRETLMRKELIKNSENKRVIHPNIQ